MSDDQDTGARVAQLADLGEQAFGRIEVESGGGFVEDEKLRLRQQRAADGDPRLEVQRQRAGWHFKVKIETGQFGHQRLGRLTFGRSRQCPRPKAVSPEIEIVEQRAFVGDQHLLKHGGDPDPARIMGRIGCVAQNVDLARIDRQHARYYLGERALAAAVAAENRMDLAERGVERSPVERSCHVERFVNADQRDGARAEQRVWRSFVLRSFMSAVRDKASLSHPRAPRHGERFPP